MGPRWIDDSLPGVSHFPTPSRGIALRKTGERVCTWHSFESKGYKLSALDGARYLQRVGAETMFVLNPVLGQLVQMLPADVGSRTLKAGKCVTNAHGSFHAQVEVIGDAHRPWTNDLTPEGRRALGYLIEFLRDNGVPDRWAGGVRPPAYPGPGVRRFMPAKGESGHTHHAAWTCNDHGDPGAIADPWKWAHSVKPSPTPPKRKADKRGRYTVRKGDTLGAIAADFDTSVEALQMLSGITNPNRIEVGQLIRLP